ncbi:MAG: hypothetical protein ACFFER_10915 [Candidatus Thorarchaeota archaeon]
MRGLGNQVNLANLVGSLVLKAREASELLQGKSLLLTESDVSALGESAADHYVQLGPLITGDRDELSDDDPAVVRTVESLSVVEIDILDTKTGEGSLVYERDSVPMSIDKAPANSKSRFGRWRHWQGKGRTQKLQSQNLALIL